MAGTMRLAIVGSALALMLPVSVMAAGPGFDCRKAKAADEKAICRSAELGRRDRQVLALYREARTCLLMGGRAEMRDDQIDWLTKRAACGASGTCLRTAYKTRISQLTLAVSAARKMRTAGQCPDQ